MNTKNYITLLQKPVTYCYRSTDPSRDTTAGKSDAGSTLRVAVSPQQVCWAAVARPEPPLRLSLSPRPCRHLRPPPRSFPGSHLVIPACYERRVPLPLAAIVPAEAPALPPPCSLRGLGLPLRAAKLRVSLPAPATRRAARP